MAAAEGTATTATEKFLLALKGLGTSLKTLVLSHPILTTIALVGTGIALYTKFGDTLENLQEKAQKSKEDYEQSISEINSLNEQLKTTKDRIEELQNKDSLTIVENNELEKLKTTNDELERELRIQEAIAQRKGKKAADDAENAINKKSEEYNGHFLVGDNDTALQYAENPYVYDKGDRLDVATWDIEQAKQNNQELEELYQKRKQIEDKYNNDASQFQDDSEWKNNEKNIESKKAYIKTVEDSASAYIEALMGEDDALYDSNGKIIKGKEDLVKRLLDLYKMFDEYNTKENIGDKFTSALEDKGVSEDSANKIKSQLSDDEIKKATELDILPYIDENATVESVREAIKKAQEEADKNPVDGTVTFAKDPTSLLTESDDKSKTANLADLKSEADTLKSLQKELEDTGVIGVDSMQKIIKQYPEAKEALYDYMTDVKNEAELFADLKNIYNDDKNQYINSMVEQNQANEDFFASLKAKYPEIVTEMQNLVDQTNALLDQQKENYINSIVSEEESCQAFLNFIKETYPELYAQLSEIYGNDEKNFIRHIISENETNQEFIDALSKLYLALANNLATTYGNDVSN